jgi:2-methylcitrate dehydratase PrpD
MLAYRVGFEVVGLLGRALYPEIVGQGWLPVGVFGVMMPTAACARPLKLNQDQVQHALGIAAKLNMQRHLATYYDLAPAR